MNKLSTFLVQESLLSEADMRICIASALQTQQSLARVILSNDNLSPDALYNKIAEFEKLEFADLRNHPCDKELSSQNMRDNYIALSAIPWKKNNGNIVIATSEITSPLQE